MYFLWRSLSATKRQKKNPNRWRKAVLCRTATRPGQKTFKESILDTCIKRDDEQAHQVRNRVEGALSDLHAADGRYHVDCMTSFMSARSINAAANTGLEAKKNSDSALDYVINEMSKNNSQIWNSLQIWHLYEKYGGKDLVRKSLLQKIRDNFGDNIAVLSSSGLASLIVFRKNASALLNLVNDSDEDELSILTDKLAKTITSEIKEICVDKSRYSIRITKENISNKFCKFDSNGSSREVITKHEVHATSAFDRQYSY